MDNSSTAPRESLGETRRQLRWAQEWLAGGWHASVAHHGTSSEGIVPGKVSVEDPAPHGAEFDPTVDQAWRIDQWAACDTFVMAVLYCVAYPKCLLVVPILIVLLIPPMAVVWAFQRSVPPEAPAVQRTPGFHAAHAAALVLSLPAILVVCVTLALDFTIMALLGCIWALAACRIHRVWGSIRAADPFRGGPWLLWYTADITVALVGHMHRHGFLETVLKVSVMLCYNPWWKYWIGANPWVSDLGIRFITQISTRMDDMATDDVERECRNLITCCKVPAEARAEADAMFFSPHYPSPPPGPRHMALAMQLASGCTLLVHTTHLYQVNKGPPPLTLSRSILRPLYRVMLWHNNPFHILTGWVEASISTGLPSQPDKPQSAEHPMWILCGHNYLSAHRDSPAYGPAYIDHFFDEFLPVFVHYIRSRVRGKEAADQLWQEVVSKDGVSRPAAKLGGEPQQADRLIG